MAMKNKWERIQFLNSIKLPGSCFYSSLLPESITRCYLNEIHIELIMEAWHPESPTCKINRSVSHKISAVKPLDLGDITIMSWKNWLQPGWWETDVEKIWLTVGVTWIKQKIWLMKMTCHECTKLMKEDLAFELFPLGNKGEIYNLWAMSGRTPGKTQSLA